MALTFEIHMEQVVDRKGSIEIFDPAGETSLSLFSENKALVIWPVCLDPPVKAYEEKVRCFV